MSPLDFSDVVVFCLHDVCFFVSDSESNRDGDFVGFLSTLVISLGTILGFLFPILNLTAIVLPLRFFFSDVVFDCHLVAFSLSKV